MCGLVHTCLQGPELWAPRQLEVTDSCELPHVGAGSHCESPLRAACTLSTGAILPAHLTLILKYPPLQAPWGMSYFFCLTDEGCAGRKARSFFEVQNVSGHMQNG